MEIEDSWVKTQDGSLFVRMWLPNTIKNNAPIIMFHDSLGCVELWRNLPALLSERTGRIVIAYDRLGFGKSDQRQDKLHVEFIREEAHRSFTSLKADLKIDKFIAFGHSVGGGMAVNCAALFSEDCVGLITESAQAFVEDKTRAGIIEAKELFTQTVPFERLKKYHEEKTRWVLDAWIETWLSPEFSDWSLKEVLPNVKCPTCVIHGSEDEYGSRLHPEMISTMVSGPVKMEIMAGTRHVPHRVQEDRVLDIISSFIA